MKAGITIGFVGSKLGTRGSSGEKLMLRVSSGKPLAPLADSRRLTLFSGLAIVSVSSFFIGCLFVSFRVLLSFRSASNFNSRVFVKSVKSPLSRLSSTSFFYDRALSSFVGFARVIFTIFAFLLFCT